MKQSDVSFFVGFGVGIIGTVLVCVFFGWKLALGVFLMIGGNNASQNSMRLRRKGI